MNYIKTNFLSLVSAIIIFAGVPLALAWTTPPPNPPNDNVSAPVNVSDVGQSKVGGLGLGSLAVFGQVRINTTAANYLMNDATRPNRGLLSMGVNGKVGAEMYCDQDGNSCAKIADLLVASTNTTTNTTTGTLRTTAPLVPGYAQKPVRLGPPGCNSILTTGTTCRTGGFESCGGGGCESRYFSCSGGAGGRTPATCDTLITNISVQEIPSR